MSRPNYVRGVTKLITLLLIAYAIVWKLTELPH